MDTFQNLKEYFSIRGKESAICRTYTLNKEKQNIVLTTLVAAGLLTFKQDVELRDAFTNAYEREWALRNRSGCPSYE